MRLVRSAAGQILEQFITATGAAQNFVKNAQAKEIILTARLMNVVRVVAQKLMKMKTPCKLSRLKKKMQG